jgi:hypothetical protein
MARESCFPEICEHLLHGHLGGRLIALVSSQGQVTIAVPIA